MINKSRLVSLTQQLIRIDSQNPPGDEFRIAGFIKKYLALIGVRANIYEFKKRRSNIVAFLAGKDRSRSLLITPHLDTVPCGAHWRKDPFSGRIRNGRIYGLGSTDCKGNLACSIEVLHSLVEDRAFLDYNLFFAATADEESGSGLGLVPLLAKGILAPDAAVVLDSDEFNIIITQKGLIHLKVKLQGRRAHGAYPWRGINAIDKAMAIIRELKSRKWDFSPNHYLKPPTLNIGTIRGGDKVNIVADWCEFELDFRFLPGSSAEKILQQIRRIVQKYTRDFTIEIQNIQKPYLIDKDHPLVGYMKKAIKRIGALPLIKGSEGATTITFFQNKNIPAIATGFGSSGCAHIADEYAKIDNLYKGAIALEDFLKTFNF